MSHRLNKSHKVYIANKSKALSPINKQIEELKEERKLLAEKIRIESLGGAEKAIEYQNTADKIIKLLDNLPENILSHTRGITSDNKIYVRTDTQYYSRRYITLPKSAVVPNTCYDMPSNSKYLPALLLSLETEEKLFAQLADLYDEVMASISSITTVKKLLEQWEEAIELLPDELKQAKVMLPALRTTKLNTLIGLPSNKVKKTSP